MTETFGSSLSRLVDVLSSAKRTLVLTGAGCSTESGISDYRDEAGNWKHRQPVRFADFVRSEAVRRRYWARSCVGFATIARAIPNSAHRALALLERHGAIDGVITQNVDGLHQKAGSQRVIDLHGRLDKVECLACGHAVPREGMQRELVEKNPAFRPTLRHLAPDGDAELDAHDYASFQVPACPSCGGIMKPSVVFFGENIPAARSTEAFEVFDRCDALLVIGSSLMVFSGYRFARKAVVRNIPVCVVNLGRTRIDPAASVKVVGRCGEVLPELLGRMGLVFPFVSGEADAS